LDKGQGEMSDKHVVDFDLYEDAIASRDEWQARAVAAEEHWRVCSGQLGEAVAKAMNAEQRCKELERLLKRVPYEFRTYPARKATLDFIDEVYAALAGKVPDEP
jgi:hypothetical protein